MKSLELNCSYVPEDKLYVSPFDGRDEGVYLTVDYKRGAPAPMAVKLNRTQVKELRKWLKNWLKETK